MSYLTIGKLLLQGASKSSIVKKYGKSLVDKFIKRYGNNPEKWMKESMSVGTGSIATIIGVGTINKNKKNNKNNKNKNPRLKVKKNK